MKKKLCFIAVLLVGLLACFSMLACGGGGDNEKGDNNNQTPTHRRHLYKSDDWKYDESYHWHECEECGKMDASSKVEHKFDSDEKCECGYEKDDEGGENQGGENQGEDDKQYTEGLENELNEDGQSYSVVGIGSATSTDIKQI